MSMSLSDSYSHHNPIFCWLYPIQSPLNHHEKVQVGYIIPYLVIDIPCYTQKNHRNPMI